MEASAHEIRSAALMDGVKDVAFGSVAGMVSKVFEHPFDLCKVRLQAQVLDETARFKGPVDCLMKTWRGEGVRGLYRGLPAPVVGAMVENATLFLTYGQLQRLYQWLSGSSANTTSQLIFAAGGAGAVTSFLLTPIELIKCKMQVQLLAIESSSLALGTSTVLSSSSTYTATTTKASPGITTTTITTTNSTQKPKPNFSTLPGPLSVLRTVLKTHGLRGLWLGQTGTLIRETGGAAAWFGAKEAVSRVLVRRRGVAGGDGTTTTTKVELKAWESALAGACAGVAYNVVLFPADSVKSALQTADELRPASSSSPPGANSSSNSKPIARTFWSTAKDMYASKGVRGLYAGMGITTARAIPSSALIFLIYDGLSKRFG